MLDVAENLRRSVDALAGAALPASRLGPDLDQPLFVGSGDSFAASLCARRYGHPAISSGDLAWSDVGYQRSAATVVGVSYSGRSAATIEALRIANAAGFSTAAVTAAPQSPLAEAAGTVIEVPRISTSEIIPAAGYVCLAAGVAAACGVDTTGLLARVGATLEMWSDRLGALVERLPADVPHSISILTLPDLRSAGDFWSLKFIEATGIGARSVPLEECGHVDYFIGPQEHLVLDLMGLHGRARHQRLGAALTANGQHLVAVDAIEASSGPDNRSNELVTELALAVAGAELSHQAALLWGRQPFRGGAVDMTGAHITLDERRER